MYKNVLYTLVKSAGMYVAVQKSYTVYAAKPAASQQQLAVFDLNGTTYMVTDGTTPGVGHAAGINPGTMWAGTAISTSYRKRSSAWSTGSLAQPTNVSQSAHGRVPVPGHRLEQPHHALRHPLHGGQQCERREGGRPGAAAHLHADRHLHVLTPSYPLTFETGGYNAFTTFVTETSTPSESFAGAYKTPVISTDSQVDSLITPQGDFSLEFWHSIPLTPLAPIIPFTYSASTAVPPLVYYLDVDFEDESDIYVEDQRHGDARRHGTPPVFSSGWRHFALTYAQPYVMLCQGAGFEVKQASNLQLQPRLQHRHDLLGSRRELAAGASLQGHRRPMPRRNSACPIASAISGGAVTSRF